ncbi:hypothetical protein [Paraburkholderia sp. RL17-337-BIB-A]|uniref:hypothetical protein n=1 Tax=Paraburkholderia sp. RL17-337-BIB-A TaxID=3031636 RepID=UPI0038BA2913
MSNSLSAWTAVECVRHSSAPSRLASPEGEAPIVRATTGASPNHYCTGGRITAACADPGLPRKTLYDKMRRLGISREIEDGSK